MTDTIDDVTPKQRRRSRTSSRTSCNGWFGGSSPVRANHQPAGDLNQVVRADFRTTSVISGYACIALAIGARHVERAPDQGRRDCGRLVVRQSAQSGWGRGRDDQPPLHGHQSQGSDRGRPREPAANVPSAGALAAGALRSRLQAPETVISTCSAISGQVRP
jgi:hypothetical protein